MADEIRNPDRQPRFAPPSLATDCHFHVFGPASRYPWAATRVYTPPDAPLDECLAMQRRVGIGRMVFVQASPYGTDNRSMLDAIAAVGDRARGVAVIGPAVGDAELDTLHAGGVRGIRINVATAGGTDPTEPLAQMRALAPRLGERGWHLQFFVEGVVRDALLPLLGDIGVDVVIDHMGRFPVAGFEREPGFRDLRRLLDGGRCWVKLSGADRVSPDLHVYDDALPLMRALIAANPERMVWGTDWPHSGFQHDKSRRGDATPVVPFRRLDDRYLMVLLSEAAPDEATFARILVDNPARLYDFPAA